MLTDKEREDLQQAVDLSMLASTAVRRVVESGAVVPDSLILQCTDIIDGLAQMVTHVVERAG